ncbi:MAG: complex I subunit 1/NuoH family protein [Candidatus Njordarchaeales archaeon]
MSDPILNIALWLRNYVFSLVEYFGKILGIPPSMYEYITGLIMFLIGFLAFGLDILFIVWMERKVIGRIHNRRSVTETGPVGFFQNIADVVKLLVKEDIIPLGADRFFHDILPPITAAVTLIPLVVIPFAPHFYVVRLSISLLLAFGVMALVPGLILLIGWAGGSKYTLLGGFRSGLQLIAYEIPLSLLLISIVIVTRSLDLVTIVESQSHLWNIVRLPLGALLFFIVGTMELERAPFDIPEAEGEIVAGWRTEYPGIKFGLFYGTEYFHFFVTSSLFVTLFLGGWHGPLLPPLVWFLIKVHLVMILWIWVRLTFFRPRPDQLLRICFKYMIPLAFLNLLWAIGYVAFISY